MKLEQSLTPYTNFPFIQREFGFHYSSHPVSLHMWSEIEQMAHGDEKKNVPQS